jgi:hypothetical protein
MRQIGEKTMQAFEEAALDGLKHLRAFLAYSGERPDFYQRAKIGAVAVAGFTKLVQTETNRAAITLAIDRATAPELPAKRRALNG